MTLNLTSGCESLFLGFLLALAFLMAFERQLSTGKALQITGEKIALDGLSASVSSTNNTKAFRDYESQRKILSYLVNMLLLIGAVGATEQDWTAPCAFKVSVSEESQ